MGSRLRSFGASAGKAADLVGLALHELAMNAVEHGALCVPQGSITVTWRLKGKTTARVLRFEWLEPFAPRFQRLSVLEA